MLIIFLFGWTSLVGMCCFMCNLLYFPKCSQKVFCNKIGLTWHAMIKLSFGTFFQVLYNIYCKSFLVNVTNVSVLCSNGNFLGYHQIIKLWSVSFFFECFLIFQSFSNAFSILLCFQNFELETETTTLDKSDDKDKDDAWRH